MHAVFALALAVVQAGDRVSPDLPPAAAAHLAVYKTCIRSEVAELYHVNEAESSVVNAAIAKCAPYRERALEYATEAARSAKVTVSSRDQISQSFSQVTRQIAFARLQELKAAKKPHAQD